MFAFAAWLPTLWKVLGWVGKYKKYLAYATIVGAVTVVAQRYVGHQREDAARETEARVRASIEERMRDEADREREALRRAKADAERTADPMRELHEKWRRPATPPHAELDVRPDRPGAGGGR